MSGCGWLVGTAEEIKAVELAVVALNPMSEVANALGWMCAGSAIAMPIAISVGFPAGIALVGAGVLIGGAVNYVKNYGAYDLDAPGIGSITDVRLREMGALAASIALTVSEAKDRKYALSVAEVVENELQKRSSNRNLHLLRKKPVL